VNAAVTGATGFVGSHLVDVLTGRGDAVACLVRSPERAAALALMGCRLVPGDLDDAAALDALVRDAEIVFHAAGVLGAHRERDYYQVNRGGVERVARAAHAAGVARLVHVSSLAATGPSPPGRPASDETPPTPVSIYGRSKLAGEDALRQSGVPFTIVRPPTVYGPRDREVLKIFRFASRGLAPVMGDGRQELSLIHVTDLAGALVAAAVSPAAVGRTYHATHPEVLTQRALVEAIGRAVGRTVRVVPLPAPLTRGVLWAFGTVARIARVQTLLTADKANEFLAAAWTCVSTGLERDTGWRARVGFEVGAVATARWYREQGWL